MSNNIKIIDIHCHILPGIDDGAKNMDETISMALIAANSGIKAIVATPHCNIPGLCENYFDAQYVDLFNETAKTLKNENIPVKLLAGMEVFVTYDLPQLIASEKILTINNGDYLLTEFKFDEEPEFVGIMTDKLIDMKIKPIIAHPERYEFVKEYPDFLLTLAQKGCLFQVNKGSFLSRYGKRSSVLAFDMLNQGLCDVIASDAHGANYRTPCMKELLSSMDDYNTAAKVLHSNPLCVCNNREIINV